MLKMLLPDIRIYLIASLLKKNKQKYSLAELWCDYWDSLATLNWQL